MKTIIKLMRPKHWIKNLLIFIPLFFSLKISYSNYLILALGFLTFSFLASSIYIINDIFDVEGDRMHPDKKKRPIASGNISVKNALIISLILVVLSFFINSLISKKVIITSILLGLYFTLNILYSKWLKNFPIVDIFILASGFIIRVFYGASLVNVIVSEWLLLTTLNAALFLGIGKRKKELTKKKVRKVLKYYTEDFLDKFLMVCITLTIMFYSLWVMNHKNQMLYFSIPMVLFIVMQYMLISDKENNGDPVTVFFNNKILIVSTMIYGLFMCIFLYM